MTNLEKAIKFAKLALNDSDNTFNQSYIKEAIIFLEESLPLYELNKNITKPNPLGLKISEIIERQNISAKLDKI